MNIREFFESMVTDKLIDFVYNLNRRPEQNCGYLAENAEQLKIDIHELLESEDCLLICCNVNGKLAGVAVFDGDSEKGSAEVSGPFIDDDFADSFESLARGMIDHYNKSFPEVNKLLFFPSRANSRMKSFLTAENAVFKGTHAAFGIFRQDYTSDSPLEINYLLPCENSMFIRLHTSIFPNTYYSGKYITEIINDYKKVYIIKDNSQLIGYLYAEFNPETKDSGVEFLGVAESRRRQGLGEKLLRMALYDLFINMGAAQVRLCVSVLNEGAFSLYKRLGFKVMKEYGFYTLIIN